MKPTKALMVATHTTKSLTTDARAIYAVIAAAMDYCETWMRGELTITGVRIWEECLHEGPMVCGAVTLSQTDGTDECPDYDFCMALLRHGKRWMVYDDNLPMEAFHMTREQMARAFSTMSDEADTRTSYSHGLTASK